MSTPERRVEPDGCLARSMVGYGGDADVFLRSTILRVGEEEIARYDLKAKNARRNHLEEKWRYKAAAIKAFLSRFEPDTGGVE